MQKDENGAMRHTWSKERLAAMYAELCNYFADLTEAEYREIEGAATAIKSKIHQNLLNN